MVPVGLAVKPTGTRTQLTVNRSDAMQELDQRNETRICYACAVELKELDRFCRNCGADQATGTGGPSNELRLVNQVPASSNSSPVLVPGPGPVPLETTEALEIRQTGDTSYRTVSGPLVDAVTAQSATRVSGRLHNQAVRHVLSALIAIPIWLIIVVLSPVDAYLAAKEIAGKGGVR